MATNTPTIIDLKTAFLRSQILALSQPLRPSPNLQFSISEEENSLRQKAIDDALYKLNGLLKKHNRSSYGPQAQRHVAEQVDRLYWEAEEKDVNVGAKEWAERGADLREEKIIEQLPEEWGEEAGEEALEEAAKYQELQRKLVELHTKRKAAREKLEQYKAAKKLLEPFRGEDAGLQENLVTKNGEVEKELERMRMLMLRVERGVMGLEEKGNGDEMDIDVSDDEQTKLSALFQNN